MKIISFFIILISFCTALHSEEVRYVRDTLLVPLRSGQTTKHRIVHKGVISGTRLTLVEVSEDGKYSLVRTKGGTEGWLQSQYLSDLAAGRDLYKQSLTTISKLQDSNTTLSKTLGKLKIENRTFKSEVDNLSADSGKLNTELAEIKSISTNAIRLNSDNQQLMKDKQQLKNTVDVLTTENQRLQDEISSDSFMNGAFAVLIGVMIALAVPRLLPRKRTEWA